MKNPDTSFAQTISTYHAERWVHVRKQLKQVSKNAEVENIHKARVEVKKLIALYDLIAYCAGGFDTERELEDLIKIFKKMGKMRDYTNTVCLCEKFEIDPDIFDKEKESLKLLPHKIRTKFSKHRSEFEAIERAADMKLSHVNENKWQAYLQARQKKIIIVLSSQPTTDELHRTRKEIKQLLYDCQIAADATVTNDERERLDKLQNLLGDWHDLVVFKSKLLELRIDKSQPEQYKTVKNAEQRLRRQINNPKGRAQTQRSSA